MISTEGCVNIKESMRGPNQCAGEETTVDWLLGDPVSHTNTSIIRMENATLRRLPSVIKMASVLVD